MYFTDKRYDVKWGDKTQILNELGLFELATQTRHDYYHLISGVDMPLKSQEYIHNFFEGRKDEFLYYHETPSKWDYQRISRYHFGYRGNNKLIARAIALLSDLQEKFGVDRIKKYNFVYKRGFNWCSITHEFAEYIVKNKRFIKKLVSHSVCADEVYKQVLLLNSDFKDKVFINPDSGKPEYLRYVVWESKGNHPKTFTVEDYDSLIDKNLLFARKFDEKVDMQIVDKLYNYVLELDK